MLMRNLPKAEKANYDEFALQKLFTVYQKFVYNSKACTLSLLSLSLLSLVLLLLLLSKLFLLLFLESSILLANA